MDDIKARTTLVGLFFLMAIAAKPPALPLAGDGGGIIKEARSPLMGVW